MAVLWWECSSRDKLFEGVWTSGRFVHCDDGVGDTSVLPEVVRSTQRKRERVFVGHADEEACLHHAVAWRRECVCAGLCVGDARNVAQVDP